MKHKTIFTALLLLMAFRFENGFSQGTVRLSTVLWFGSTDYKGERYENIDIENTPVLGPVVYAKMGKIILRSDLFWGTAKWHFKGRASNILMRRYDVNLYLGVELLPDVELFAMYKAFRIFNRAEEFQYTENELTRLARVANAGTFIGPGFAAKIPLGKSPYFMQCSAAWLFGNLHEKDEILDASKIILPESWYQDTESNCTVLFIAFGYLSYAGVEFLIGYRSDFNDGISGETKINGFYTSIGWQFD